MTVSAEKRQKKKKVIHLSPFRERSQTLSPNLGEAWEVPIQLEVSNTQLHPPRGKEETEDRL